MKTLKVNEEFEILQEGQTTKKWVIKRMSTAPWFCLMERRLRS